MMNANHIKNLIRHTGLFALLCLVVTNSVHAAQYARPDATGTTNGWTAVNAATHHEAVDEITFSDTDYIDSGTGNSATIVFGLSGVIDPGTYANDHIIRLRCQSTGGSKGGESCDVRLFSAGVEVALAAGSIPATRGSFATDSYTITDASAISDYSALELHITSNIDTGNKDNESIQISWVELEIPDAAVTPPTVTSPTSANVAETTATLGGTMSNDNGTAVTDCGVEWGTTSSGPYPNSQSYDAGTCASNGGVFTANVTDLTGSTNYYFRAWATNGVTGYSSEASFTTAAPASPPTVNADTASNIGQNSATLGGNVTADGGATVTARGIVWNTTSPAETGGTVVQLGSGLGAFSQVVSGMPAGTLIYFKAYATNSAGTAYSAEDAFTTLAGAPSVDSPTVTDVAATSATLGGTMTSDGGEAPSDCGIEWGTTSGGPYPNPVSDGVCSEGVPFTTPVSGLPTGTLVYFRAYATNTAGTSYSAQSSFTPAGAPVVTATPAATITLHSADLGGEVTNNGGSTVTSRGIVWDTVSPPETAGTVVPMGSGLGSFSQTVSGLPGGTQIYWKAYGTNSVATGYSAEESFSTLSEPTTPATAIVFERVAGSSMVITWTRGDGDGSLLVMRLAATGKTDPQDGDEYAANEEYPAAPELPFNSQNYAVYAGSAGRAWITGLTQNTAYSFAVYEYGGSGTGIDYLLTTPAEATGSTTDYAVHNYDYRVDCNDCHNHGSFRPVGDELKATCETCHKPGGLAANKLEFDNHLNPSKNPGVDDVDCGSCHELHNLDATNTTESTHSVTLQTQHNKSFLRANVDKYVPGAATPAYLHTDQPKREAPHPDAPQEAATPDRAIEGGNDTTARGYCQVCHSLTNYHRSTNTAGSEQCHDGEQNNSCGGTEVHCGNCHEHNNKFIGVGGSVTCVQCHDSEQGIREATTPLFDRLSTHIPGGSAAATQEDCLVCHDQGAHQAQSIKVWNADDGTTSYSQPTAAASTLATGEGEAFEPHCLSCHDSNGADHLPASGSDQTKLSPFTGAGAPPIIDATAWDGSGHDRPSATFPASPVTCVGDGANGCHASGHGSENNSLLAPAAGPATSPTDFCYGCHGTGGISIHDIEAQFAGANISATSQSGALVNQRHDISVDDQTYSGGVVSCADCHSVHVDNATDPVADPDTALPLATYGIGNSYTDDGHNFAYDSGGNLDPINPEGSAGGYSEPDYIQFCLTCHDGTAPPGVTISANLINIAAEYDSTDQHGAGEGSTGSRTGKGGLKFPYVTSADDAANNDPPNPYAAMNCTTCHGAHGTGNIFNLRESITVAGEVLTVGGAAGFLDEPAYDGSSTYTLPLIGGQQTDHYWGAWCTFCHKGDAHPGKVEADACTGAHMHGGGSF